jgi:hypothetical protein
MSHQVPNVDASIVPPSSKAPIQVFPQAGFRICRKELENLGGIWALASGLRKRFFTVPRQRNRKKEATREAI